jgi:cationic peptide transport system ATP-binding protein
MLLLDIRNLTIELRSGSNKIKAVERVNLSIKEGEVHGLVGESGSGKSLIAKAIVGVLNKRWKVTADRMHWRGQDLFRLSGKKRRQILSNEVAMIYQEPSRCLDPTSTILEQLMESIPSDQLDGNLWYRIKQRQARAVALLHKVGIKDHKLSSFVVRRILSKNHDCYGDSQKTRLVDCRRTHNRARKYYQRPDFKGTQRP